MKKYLFLIVISFVLSCNTCPSYQWFSGEKIGVRFCDVESNKSSIIIKGSVTNKSKSNIQLKGLCFDVNGFPYHLFDNGTYNQYQNNQVVAALNQIEIAPNTEIEFYYVNNNGPAEYNEGKGEEEYYHVLKKCKNNDKFTITIINNGKEEKVIVNFSL